MDLNLIDEVITLNLNLEIASIVDVAMAQPIAQKTTVREGLGSTTSDGSDHGSSGKPNLPSF